MYTTTCAPNNRCSGNTAEESPNTRTDFNQCRMVAGNACLGQLTRCEQWRQCRKARILS